MDNYYSGSYGVVKAGEKAAAPGVLIDWGVTQFDATVEAKSQDVTTTRSRDPYTGRLWERFLVTTHAANGTFEVFYDKDNPPFAVIWPGATVDAEFYVNDVDKLEGPILIESIQPKAAVNNVVSASVKWKSNGTMTLPSDGIPTTP